MSVHGEFERYARELSGLLRAGSGGPAQADAIEQVADDTQTPLNARATSILDMDLPALCERGLQNGEDEAAEVAERLLAICRIIVGR